MTPPDATPAALSAPTRRPFRAVFAAVAVSGLLAGLAGLGWFTAAPRVAAMPLAPDAGDAPAKAADAPAAPELDGGIAWLNTAGPIKMKDLKGKIVLLDFWTLCCINCIHVMPDLAKLEKKYPDQLVVIGVHSAKFENEKDTKSIRKAVLRYELAHPVVNDADHKIWDRFGVQSWPTMVMIDPEGKVLGAISGEGNFETLDRVIGKLVETHRAKKTLDETPLRFDLVRFRETADTPLFFPGKILADAPGNRLFIADSTHHRVVVTDLTGKKLAIAGSGSPGKKDGAFADAQFDDPQGMALDGDTLYVADRKNHTIRALDLKANTVTTIAGTGEQDGGFENRLRETPSPARTTGLNSPWDVLLVGKTLYIAMAGHHQIWAMDLAAKTVVPVAGDGRENIKDGPPYAARFAQPSGLATDGKNLFVADSEVSAIRRMPLDGKGRVDTLVGKGLFEFGDIDGPGDTARLQHALGVAFHDGKLYVADTYNSKLKVIDPATRQVSTFLGGDPKAPLFDEPAGLSISGGKIYVADTNSNRIRVVDLASKTVSTLALQGVEPPPPQKEWLPPAPPTPPKK
ncbi:MAG: thioredoxin-like domain-containing protein [Fimbriiglobus sp.]